MKNMIRLVLLVAAIVGVGFAAWQWWAGDRDLDYNAAVDRLDSLQRRVDAKEEFVRGRAQINLGNRADLKDTLPAISKYPLVVNPPVGRGTTVVEIFASTEKSGSGSDGWLTETAKLYNASNQRLSDGSVAKVRIRKIPSGTGYQFIASRKHIPQGFSPSNHLWVAMVQDHGIGAAPVSERLVANVAGVVMKSEVAASLKSNYGELTIPNLLDAVVQGNLVMGYTNPFASSTGLNFLVTVLASFSQGDESNMLSPGVISAFEGFQRGVPFVALTTLQMRDSVRQDGSLDAFVMEYQTFIKTRSLQSGYEFLPFGIPHDNPLYSIGDLSPAQTELMSSFAKFTEGDKFQSLATQYGFNPNIDHQASFEIPGGDTLIQAQRLWKEKKDSGRPIVAVFLCDVSGSMRGPRLRGVKQALSQGAEFITDDNSIGVVLFSTQVKTVLPIKRFDLNHKASFLAAIQQMDAGGGTAMYDGVTVALAQLVAAKRNQPDAKPVLFVLTDGQTNEGLGFKKIANVAKGLNIPIYTIGYEADIDELRRLSSLVEAASLNADEGEVKYKIGSLLNAQM